MKFITIAVIASLVAAGFSMINCWDGYSFTSNNPILTKDMSLINCRDYCSKTVIDNTVVYGCGDSCQRNGRTEVDGVIEYCCNTDKCNIVGAKGISLILMAVSLVTSLAL